ncbi:YhgN family NAAT transporter [Buchnera aphidicola (Kurisakia onigurumii)]|uniref:YhgN family NAAT transporter n=1 Tax=Buchnera aphidicola TaxID=9 RepID=UPI0031B721D7
MHEIISNSILLILIMDPLGNLPLFMSLLKNFSPKKQRLILIREMLFSLIIMLIFLFSGEKILHSLNVKTETVSISGGIILFLIAIKMIFPIEYNDKMFIKEKNIEEPFLVPLAIPLVAGPSLLATLMLLSHQYSKNIIYLIISLIISWLFTLIILLLSGLFLKILGKKGVNVLEKLMGLILIMLSIQMFLNGIKIWFHS